MRFYKKISLYLTMGIMGLGLASFSFYSSDTPASDLSEQEVLTASFLEGTPNNPNGVFEKAFNLLPTPTPTLTPVPTLTPTPTPIPTNDLLKNEYPEINNLIKSYFDAKLECTEESFDGLVNDVSYLNLEKLQKKTEYIKSYENIVCYTKKGNDEIDYIVYITYDIAVTTIDELAPSIDQLLIKHTADGKPQIFFGETTNETETYIAELDAADDVQKLVKKINKSVKKAIEADADLAGFLTKLQAVDNETDDNQTETPEKTSKKDKKNKTKTTNAIDPKNNHEE